MSSSIQMKEGMGEATINEQQQGMIIKVVGAVAFAHLLNDLIDAKYAVSALRHSAGTVRHSLLARSITKSMSNRKV